MQPQILVYGLPAGATEDWQALLLSANCKTIQDIDTVKRAAATDGFHSFTVTRWDGSPPDFAKTLRR